MNNLSFLRMHKILQYIVSRINKRMSVHGHSASKSIFCVPGKLSSSLQCCLHRQASYLNRLRLLALISIPVSGYGVVFSRLPTIRLRERELELQSILHRRLRFQGLATASQMDQ